MKNYYNVSKLVICSFIKTESEEGFNEFGCAKYIVELLDGKKELFKKSNSTTKGKEVFSGAKVYFRSSDFNEEIDYEKENKKTFAYDVKPIKDYFDNDQLGADRISKYEMMNMYNYIIKQDVKKYIK